MQINDNPKIQECWKQDEKAWMHEKGWRKQCKKGILTQTREFWDINLIIGFFIFYLRISFTSSRISIL